ncbi:ArsR/SmtB family transcription factor [Actinopolyspora mortivallis]|uniref:ArsR/SmtB family transcription factor n=1 Tax=Actinopolyspora mortivallis TaxID=33906 RepID=UPI000686FA1F|nr:helix-turn-helix transcriptional regulator [Actinopolyspora mortivallis]
MSELSGVPGRAGGDADISVVATLLADPARAKVLMALADGRALPASVLADEAGLSRQATSAHLNKLLGGGLLSVESSGRHRYYRLASTDIATALESLARLAPTTPIRSLRQGTRAQALRAGRMCYDHLAGGLGVSLLAALLEQRALLRADGRGTPQRRDGDRLSAPVRQQPYQLGPEANYVLPRLGVDLDALAGTKNRRPLLRCCMDWSEQQHHLAGRLGAALATSFLEHGWVHRKPRQRAVTLTDAGAEFLCEELGLTTTPAGTSWRSSSSA